MRAEYDRQLRELEEELFDMGSMCQQAVAFSGAVLIGDDETLREQVCSLEMEIDKKDRLKTSVPGCCFARPRWPGTSDSSQQP